MNPFAAVLARIDGEWSVTEVSLAECESIADVADLARDVPGNVRYVLIEQDDEYAAIVRVEDDDLEPRAFLSNGHAADEYPTATWLADELTPVVDDELSDDEDAPPAHTSAPFGDAEIVEEIGTPAADLLAMCQQEGTLPIDMLVAICEKAGCGEAFEELRA